MSTTSTATPNSTLTPATNPSKKVVRVAAGLIIKDYSFLIAQRSGKRHLAGFWELPGGKIEAHETPAQTCQREISEELHCQVAVDSYFLTCTYDYEDFTLSMDVYLCHLLPGEHLECAEHSALKFITVDEIDSFNFAPADIQFLPNIKALMQSLKRKSFSF